MWTWQRKDLTEHFDPPNELKATGPAVGPSTPLQMFSNFLTDDIIEALVLESNRQRLDLKREKVQPVTVTEMRSFIGACLYMSIVNLPGRRMYWSPKTKQATVADAMTCNRFEEILSILHANDNETAKPKSQKGYDKLHKIRPLILALNKNFDSCAEKEVHVSCDEQMIPFKGRNALKVFMKNKPKKWGYKVWVQAGTSGYVHKFKLAGDNLSEEEIDDLICNKSTPRRNAQIEKTSTKDDFLSYDEKWQIGKSGETILMLLREQLPGSYAYFDNYFSSPDLLAVLKQKGIKATCTMRADRMRNCPLLKEKDLKKKGRGSYDFGCDQETEVLLCRWYDNKVVSVGSNTHPVEPTHKVRRYDGKEKKHIEVDCPSLIKYYNKNMGGVDKCDMLISLYRIFLKTRKWYKRIIFHLIDMCITNAWILYRASKDATISLCIFKLEVARGLLLSSVKRSEGFAVPHPPPSLTVSAKDVNVDCRYDGVEHFSKLMDIKNSQRCKMAKCERKTKYKCRKCKVFLCINPKVKTDDDCFFLFHHK